jgi:hypothetical protein
LPLDHAFGFDLPMYTRLQSRCDANADTLTSATGELSIGNGLRHRNGHCCVAAG